MWLFHRSSFFIKEYAITEGETIETILTRLFLKKNKEEIIMKKKESGKLVIVKNMKT